MTRGEEVAFNEPPGSDSRLPIVSVHLSQARAVEVSRTGVTVRMTYEDIFEVFASCSEVLDVDELKILSDRISKSKIYKVIQGRN